MNALSVQNLTVTYDKTPVLQHVGFDIPKGSLTGIIGQMGPVNPH